MFLMLIFMQQFSHKSEPFSSFNNTSIFPLENSHANTPLYKQTDEVNISHDILVGARKVSNYYA